MPVSLGYRLGNIRAIFLPSDKRLRLSCPNHFSLIGSEHWCSLATGYDSRFSVSNAKLHNEMEKTIPLQPEKKIRATFSQLFQISHAVRKILLSIASVLSMVTIYGVAVDNYPLTVAAASAALAIIAFDEAQEGGAE